MYHVRPFCESTLPNFLHNLCPLFPFPFQFIPHRNYSIQKEFNRTILLYTRVEVSKTFVLQCEEHNNCGCCNFSQWSFVVQSLNLGMQYRFWDVATKVYFILNYPVFEGFYKGFRDFIKVTVIHTAEKISAEFISDNFTLASQIRNRFICNRLY